MKETYFSAYRRTSEKPAGELRSPEHLAYIDEPAKGFGSSLVTVLALSAILLSMLVW